MSTFHVNNLSGNLCCARCGVSNEPLAAFTPQATRAPWLSDPAPPLRWLCASCERQEGRALGTSPILDLRDATIADLRRQLDVATASLATEREHAAALETNEVHWLAQLKQAPVGWRYQRLRAHIVTRQSTAMRAALEMIAASDCVVDTCAGRDSDRRCTACGLASIAARTLAALDADAREGRLAR